MQKVESAWKKNGDWKSRYSRLYSSHRSSHIPERPEQEPTRISFMSNETTPYQSLLSRSRRNSAQSEDLSPYFSSILAHRSSMFSSNASAAESMDICIHGYNMRYTERSVSRSRVSRISTKRDMDIPSILAFTTSTVAPIHQLQNPAFQKASNLKREEIPRWSIRRSVCPVCSQKWKDRTAIRNVKYSGLKRNSALDLPSVIAPARLRAAITMAYTPRPALAVVDEDASGYRIMRNSSAAWQLTRARKFRAPKFRPPPPEATAPPSVAEPLARQDLDIRVNKFLSDVK